jgi:alpha-L-fucosidase
MLALAAGLLLTHANAAPIKFESTVESLKQYTVPEWFEDAKLGMWAHWGPQGSTDAPYPMDVGWYGRFMYDPGNPVYQWHLKNFGHPSVFGYKDILKRWNPSKFDAARADHLMKLYKKAGAKFFVALGTHHDNVDMWDSKYQPRWNAKALTGKDIVGLWHDATINNGLRFGVSSHVARSYRWFQTAHGEDAGGKYDGQDPANADLYGAPWHENSTVYESLKDKGPEAWEAQFQNRMIDLLDKYHPDLYYTDGGIPFEHAGLNILSHFYNMNQVWNGKLDAVAPIKLDYTENIAVMDYEFSSSSAMSKYPFMSDKSLNTVWFWTKGEGPHYKTANETIDYLVDLVSKNGVLCLNIPQKPDGTLEPEAETLLAGMGQCLGVIGEAVFSTRVWNISGEGPTNMTDFASGTAKDIRFTRNKANTVLYATVLDWPGNGATLDIHSLTPDSIHAADIASITLLGSSGKITWKQDAAGLHVVMPTKAPESLYAYSLKIALRNSMGVLINDDDPAVKYSGSGWYVGPNRASAYGNAIHETPANGDSFSFTFTGTGVEFIPVNDSNRGDVDIYIDDVLQQTVNCQTASEQYKQTAYRKTGLPRGKHTIKGVKKSGGLLSVDAFKVLNDTAPAQLPAVKSEVPLAGKRVLWLGDSITQIGEYVTFTEYYLAKMFPTAKFDFINVGLSSETTSGLTEPVHPGPRPCVLNRLGRALEAVKPDVVVACYGMNDGIYHPPTPEIAEAFHRGMTKLIETCKAAGAEVILLTPPPFDPVGEAPGRIQPRTAPVFGHATPYEGYDEVLADETKWELTLPGVRVIDVHGPFFDQLKIRRQTDPRFTFTIDGIHPTTVGHLLMARFILNGLGVTVPGSGGDLERELAAVQADPLYPLVKQRRELRSEAWRANVGSPETPELSALVRKTELECAALQAKIDTVRKGD